MPRIYIELAKQALDRARGSEAERPAQAHHDIIMGGAAIGMLKNHPGLYASSIDYLSSVLKD